jgi:hypothetical protein
MGYTVLDCHSEICWVLPGGVTILNLFSRRFDMESRSASWDICHCIVTYYCGCCDWSYSKGQLTGGKASTDRKVTLLLR